MKDPKKRSYMNFLMVLSSNCPKIWSTHPENFFQIGQRQQIFDRNDRKQPWKMHWRSQARSYEKCYFLWWLIDVEGAVRQGSQRTEQVRWRIAHQFRLAEEIFFVDRALWLARWVLSKIWRLRPKIQVLEVCPTAISSGGYSDCLYFR